MLEVNSLYTLIIVLKIMSIGIITNSMISVLRSKHLIIIENFSLSNRLNLKSVMEYSNFIRFFICSIILSSRLNNSFIFFILFLLIYKFLFLKYYILYADTSDKLQILILIGIILYFLSSSTLGVIFITINVLMVYFFTGYNKIKSIVWRNGDAIFMVMNSETYGNKIIANFLYKKKNMQKIFSWFIILFQVTFPLCLLNETICVFYLTIGFLFHLTNMVIMKLHNFFWVFVSTYPCIYFVSLSVENYLLN